MMRIQKKVFAVAAAVLIATNAGLTVSAAEWVVNEDGGYNMMGGIYVCCENPLVYTMWEKDEPYVQVHGNPAMASATTSITIPASFDGKTVRAIDWHAFAEFSALQTISIPASLVDGGIGVGAFWGCNQLTDVYYAGTEQEWYELWCMDNATKENAEYIITGSDNGALLNATIHFAAENNSVDVPVATPVTGDNGNSNNGESNGNSTSTGTKATASTSSPKTGDNIWHVTLGAIASLGVLALLRKKR